MSLRICKIFLRVLRSYLVKYTKSSNLREFVWVVASPPWRRGPQVRAPWHHECHGAVDIVGPVVPPGRASVRGYAGVYTDWRKRPLGAVLGHSCTLLRRCNTARPQGTAPELRRRVARAASRRGASWSDVSRKGAVCGSHVAQNALFRHVAARGARDTTPPPACGALWRMAQLGKCARATPRQAAGGCAGDPQAPAWGPAARKSAVWAEGLADSTPWARPGHHQAASCGLRRCLELRVAGISPWTALRYRSS